MIVRCASCGILFHAEAVIIDPGIMEELKTRNPDNVNLVRGKMCRICSCPDFYVVFPHGVEETIRTLHR